MAAAKTASRIIFAVELNSNSVMAQRLEDFDVSHSVRELKMEIAKAICQPTDWRDISPFFVGLELTQDSNPLSFYRIQNADTVYFVRSIVPRLAPPEPSPNDAVAAKPAPVPLLENDVSGPVLSTVFFKTIQGRTLTLSQLPVSLSIKDMMTRLVEEKNLEDPKFLRLLFGGKQLMPRATLGDYNITNESTIDIVYRLAGGIGAI